MWCAVFVAMQQPLSALICLSLLDKALNMAPRLIFLALNLYVYDDAIMFTYEQGICFSFCLIGSFFFLFSFMLDSSFRLLVLNHQMVMIYTNLFD